MRSTQAFHVNTHRDHVLHEHIQRMAFSAGYLWHGAEPPEGNRIGFQSYDYILLEPNGYMSANMGRPSTQHSILSANNQINEIRAMMGLPLDMPVRVTQAAPERCIIKTFGDPVLGAELARLADLADVRMSGGDRVRAFQREAGFRFSGRTGMVCTYASPAEWFDQQEEYNDWVKYDARTDMPQIRAFFGQGESNMNETNQTQPATAEPIPPSPQTRFVVKVTNEEQMAHLQALAIAAGYYWDQQTKTKTYHFDYFGVEPLYISLGAFENTGRNIIDRRFICQSGRRSSFWRTAADRTVVDFDAATQMEELKAALTAVREWWQSAPRPKLAAATFIQAQLLEMIKAQPGAEVTRGLIRRDLKLKLPEEVQAAGVDSILKWLEENYKSEVDWPAESGVTKATPTTTEAQPASHRFRFKYSERVQYRVTRFDQIEIEVAVPDRVVREAISESDNSIITEWISENYEYTEETALNRIEGEGIEDEETHEYDDTINIYVVADELMARVRNA